MGQDREEYPRETAAQPAEVIAEVMQQISSSAHVSAAFEQPHVIGDRTLIPAAEVMYGLGFSLGSGEGQPRQDTPTDSGSGGGGGGGSRVRPIATVVVEREGVRVEPILDVTQIALAGITAGTLSLLSILRLLRARGESEAAISQPESRGLARLFRLK